MTHIKFVTLIILLLPSLSLGGSLEFTGLEEDDVKAVLKDFSANFIHTTVSGASSLGDVVGIELGVVAGATDAKNLDRLSEEDVDKLPYAGLIGVLSFPYGIGIEANIIPKTSSDDSTFQSSSYAVHWNLMDAFNPDSLIGVRVRAYSGTVDFDFEQEVNNVDVDVSVETNTQGGDITASLRVGSFLEPYFGIGTVTSKGKMEVDGSETIFDTDFTSSDSVEETVSGSTMYAGILLKLFVINLGFEYGSMLGTTRYAGKASLAIGF